MGITFSALRGGLTPLVPDSLKIAVEVDVSGPRAVQRALKSLERALKDSIDPTFFRDNRAPSDLAILALYTHADERGASTEFIEKAWEAAIEGVAEHLSPVGKEAVLHTLGAGAIDNAFSQLLSEPIRLCLAAQVLSVQGHSYELSDAISEAVSGGATRETALNLIESNRCKCEHAFTQAAGLYKKAAKLFGEKGSDKDAVSAGLSAGRTYTFLAGTHMGTDRFGSASDAFFAAERVFLQLGILEPEALFLAADAKSKAEGALSKAQELGQRAAPQEFDQGAAAPAA
ncbi:hypothetical protein MB84_28380 (plasmid) [Pandoraea oxalativorans]|uniref:Uncharacterized protein n=2 Tax=Pandoraea oxalativorans TaxID=573737 RepID=A0A0G3IDM9_9BURK|nr:hypothetical protein MB84_28380 [Pandoraea oxalativorans]